MKKKYRFEEDIAAEYSLSQSFVDSQTSARKKGRKKKIAGAFAGVLLVVLAGFGIGTVWNNHNIETVQQQILADLQQTETVQMQNFGQLSVEVPVGWDVQSSSDNSDKKDSSFSDPITNVQRIKRDENGKTLAVMDVRYLGEDGADVPSVDEVASELQKEFRGEQLLESEYVKVPVLNTSVEGGAWRTELDKENWCQITTQIIHIDESYYAVSCVMPEKYFSEDVFRAMVGNTDFDNYVSAVPTKLTVSYDGANTVGTVIGPNNTAFKATVDFDNGISRDVTNEIEISGDPKELKAGEKSTWTAKYTYAGSTVEDNYSVTCASKLTKLKMKYSGSTKRGTKVDDLKDFTVLAVYETPGQDDIEKDVTSEAELVNPGTLKANKSIKFKVKYADKSASYKVKCSTKMQIKAEYTGETDAGTEINDLDDFTVTAIYTEDEEIVDEVDVTESAKLKNKATLKAGGAESFTITYAGVTASCKVKCSDSIESTSSHSGTASAYGGKGWEGTSSESTYTYVLNTNTYKFHYQGCSDVDRMAEHNKYYYEGTRSEVVNMGYSPCKHCQP